VRSLAAAIDLICHPQLGAHCWPRRDLERDCTIGGLPTLLICWILHRSTPLIRYIRRVGMKELRMATRANGCMEYDQSSVCLDCCRRTAMHMVNLDRSTWVLSIHSILCSGLHTQTHPHDRSCLCCGVIRSAGSSDMDHPLNVDN